VPTVSIVFCDRCGSEKVDVASVREGKEREFRFRCYDCHGEGTIRGFSVGRAEAPDPTLREARSGRAGQQTMKLPRLSG
jgi:hypothetical protein